MSIKFEFLPHDGESILITIDENQPSQHTLLVDGGCTHPFRDRIQPDINTVIITHIDHDHIKGIIELLEENTSEQNATISRVLFNEPKESRLFTLMNNSTQTSMSQGSKLKDIIDNTSQRNKHIYDICAEQNNIIQITQSTYLQILTPTMEILDKLHKRWNKTDYEKTETETNSRNNHNQKNKSIHELINRTFEKDGSLPNQSSISFILHHNQYKFLFLGDAHIDQVNKSLLKLDHDKEALAVDFVKVSHHGSRKNINNDFLSMIKTNQYIICPTYPGDNRHPDKEAIARIVALGSKRDETHPTMISITKDNNINSTFTNEDRSTYHFDISNITELTYH